jgi:hypothetical protein
MPSDDPNPYAPISFPINFRYRRSQSISDIGGKRYANSANALEVGESILDIGGANQFQI